jgi:hypothetical protein
VAIWCGGFLVVLGSVMPMVSAELVSWRRGRSGGLDDQLEVVFVSAVVFEASIVVRSNSSRVLENCAC